MAIICPVLAFHNFHCTQCSIADFIEIIHFGRWGGNIVVFSPVTLKEMLLIRNIVVFSHVILKEMLLIRKKAINAVEGVEKRETSYTVGGNAN